MVHILKKSSVIDSIYNPLLLHEDRFVTLLDRRQGATSRTAGIPFNNAGTSNLITTVL